MHLSCVSKAVVKDLLTHSNKSKLSFHIVAVLLKPRMSKFAVVRKWKNTTFKMITYCVVKINKHFLIGYLILFRYLQNPLTNIKGDYYINGLWQKNKNHKISEGQQRYALQNLQNLKNLLKVVLFFIWYCSEVAILHNTYTVVYKSQLKLNLQKPSSKV